MPDVSGGQQGGAGSQGGGHAQPPLPHHVKAPVILHGWRNEHYEQAAPPLMRLVVGVSQAATPQAPPHRLVEGDTAPPQLMPLMPTSREVEGKSHTAPYPGQQMYTTQPQQTREPLKGQSDPLQARVVSARPAVSSPIGPTSLSLPPHQPPSRLSVQVPPLDHPAPHQSPADARSKAAGSDRRDVDVIGGPPPQVRPAPLPTTGKDIAGEESQTGGGYSSRTWPSV